MHKSTLSKLFSKYSYCRTLFKISDYDIILASCTTALGVRRNNFKDTPQVESTDSLNAQAEERIKEIKNQGKDTVRSYEALYKVSVPDGEERSCETALEGWYVSYNLIHHAVIFR